MVKLKNAISNLLERLGLNTLASRIFLISTIPIILIVTTITIETHRINREVLQKDKTLLAFQTLLKDFNQLTSFSQSFITHGSDEESLFATGSTNETNLYRHSLKEAQSTIEEIEAMSLIRDHFLSDLEEIEENLQDLDKIFFEIMTLKISIGKKDYGQIGMWRTNIHAAEAIINKAKEYKLYTSLLMLRRHEKDYLLRNDFNYVKKFQDEYQNFVTLTEKSKVSEEIKSQLTLFTYQYKEAFLNFSNVKKIYEQKLTEYEEKQNMLSHDVLELSEAVNYIAATYLDRYNQKILYSTISIILLSTLIILLALKNLTNPINLLIEKVKNLKDEDLTELQEIESASEINLLRDTITNYRHKIHEQEKTLEINAKFKLLGEMSAQISHEILNPMTIIKNSILLLKKQMKLSNVESLEVNKKVDSIEIASGRVLDIVSNIKKLAKTNFNDSKEVFDFNQIFLQLNFLVGRKIEYAKINLMVEKFDDKEKFMGNESLLSQVLINLVTNSIQAIENSNGDKWIKVNCQQTEEDLIIEIIDSGLGIKKEIADKLFKENLTTKSGDQGTGLGLPLCRKIIEEHSGSIIIDQSRQNTTFVIKLPRYKTNESHLKLVA